MKTPTTIMLNLFGLPNSPTTGTVSVPLWDYVRSGLTQNLHQVVRYYRRFPVRVESSHLLVRLLESMGISKNQPIDKFYNYLSWRGMRAAAGCRMTTSISRGDLFDGVFYGPDNTEILIGHDDDFDTDWAVKNWVDLQPIQVLQHSQSDLGLLVPNGETQSLETGLVVIAINVPMLAIQYREFFNRETKIAEKTGENPRSIKFFLGAYPIANMLYSQLDVTLFNRLYNAVYGIPFGEVVKKHPFYLNDYTEKLNQVQMTQLDLLGKKNEDFNDVLSSIPLVSNDTLLDASHLPDTAPTRQVIWALILARLKMLSFAANVSSRNARAMSGVQANQILKLFSLYNADKVFQSSLPPDLYFSVKQDLTQITKALRA